MSILLPEATPDKKEEEPREGQKRSRANEPVTVGLSDREHPTFEVEDEAVEPKPHALLQAWRYYSHRMTVSFPCCAAPGGEQQNPYVVHIYDVDLIPTVLLSFTAMMLLVIVGDYLISDHISRELSTLLIPSFGASCALLFGLPKSPLSQPRNLVMGHFWGALAGLCIAQPLRDTVEQPLGSYVAAALAVGVSLSLMMTTNTVHPPGCATAIIAAVATFSPELADRGFWFLISPTLSGSLILFLVAWLGNNLFPWRAAYPMYW